MPEDDRGVGAVAVAGSAPAFEVYLPTLAALGQVVVQLAVDEPEIAEVVQDISGEREGLGATQTLAGCVGDDPPAPRVLVDGA